MVSNGEKCRAKSEGQKWHYLRVKKTNSTIKRNNF